MLNEKGVQTQGSWHSTGRPPKQDEKLFDQYEFVNKTVIVRFYADIFWYYIYCLSLSFYLCSSWHFTFDKISTIYYEIDEVETGHSTQKLFLLFGCSLSTVSWVFWCGWLLWISDFHHWCPGLIMKTYGAQCHSVSRKRKNCYHWLLKLLFTSCQIFIPGHRQFHIRNTNYTVKVLIAITPQGSACFLSKAWGGRTSDKFENDNCGILKKILPGDFSFSRPWF